MTNDMVSRSDSNRRGTLVMNEAPYGWFALHRKVFKYAERPYCPFVAWLWLIAGAVFDGPQRGMLRVSYQQMADAWGWKKGRVRKQLKLWEDDGRLTFSGKVVTQVTTWVTTWGTTWGTTWDTRCLTITICNYDQYQSPIQESGHKLGHKTGHNPAHDPGHNFSYILIENNKKQCTTVASATDDEAAVEVSEDKTQETEMSPQPRSERKKPAPKNRAVIHEMLNEIDLDKFRRAYGDKIDVDTAWDRYRDIMLHGTPKDPEPNPWGHRDFNKSFHNFCKHPWRLNDCPKKSVIHNDVPNLSDVTARLRAEEGIDL